MRFEIGPNLAMVLWALIVFAGLVLLELIGRAHG